jgi:hypothetical protein
MRVATDAARRRVPREILTDGVAFTGEGKLVRNETGYDQEKAEGVLSTAGSRAARAELPAAIGRCR